LNILRAWVYDNINRLISLYRNNIIHAIQGQFNERLLLNQRSSNSIRHYVKWNSLRYLAFSTIYLYNKRISALFQFQDLVYGRIARVYCMVLHWACNVTACEIQKCDFCLISINCVIILRYKIFWCIYRCRGRNTCLSYIKIGSLALLWNRWDCCNNEIEALVEFKIAHEWEDSCRRFHKDGRILALNYSVLIIQLKFILNAAERACGCCEYYHLLIFLFYLKVVATT